MNKKTNKILLTICLIVLGLLVHTTVSAFPENFEVYYNSAILEYKTKYDTSSFKGHFDAGNYYFCIGKHLAFGDYATYNTNHDLPVGTRTSRKEKLWYGEDHAYSMRYKKLAEYEMAEGKSYEIKSISYPERGSRIMSLQDTAYVLAFARKAAEPGEYNKYFDFTTLNLAYPIWTTELAQLNKSANDSSDDNWDIYGVQLRQDAAAYKNFYDSIHGEGVKSFSDRATLSGSNAKVETTSDGSYIVGPYSFSFYHATTATQQFSWVESINAIPNAGASITNLQILNSSKNAVVTDYNSLNNKNFYIKFKSTNAANVKVQVNFKYLASCNGKIATYSPEVFKYEWVLKNGAWEMTKTVYNNTKAQPFMLVEGDIIPNYQVVTRESSPVDLTFDLSGYVFLDQDQGKVNEGNNVMDAGEKLANVEVRLYDTSNNLKGITKTNNDGYYKFTGLNPSTSYYVRFTYNGMMYTNVASGTNNNSSKATESSQSHNNNRQTFNNKFAEIGSYPQNYKTKSWRNGGDIYNKVYPQEQIVSLFKEISEAISKNGGNEGQVYQSIIDKYRNSDSEIEAKVQFVADCRINAYTVSTYTGAGDKENVNLGIKARQTVDLVLYKDVAKAEVSINGKSQTYNYGESDEATFGVSEVDYLNGLRNAYQNSQVYTNAARTRKVEEDEKYFNLRAEEVANGNNETYTGKTGIDNKYATNNTNYNLQGNDKLKVFVTYKITIKKDGSLFSRASVTEIADYFDKNYQFVEAYVGNSKGEKTGDVTKHDTSIYGGTTEYKSTNGAYKTVYLRPNAETKLGAGESQYIYVKLQLVGDSNDAGELLKKNLLDNNSNLKLINLAEINGYKTYNKDNDLTPGLIDIDSNPGNLNISTIGEFTHSAISKAVNEGRAIYEDDTRRAPVLVYKLQGSRTIEGTVFEDINKDASIGNGDKNIAGVKVELLEIKNGQIIKRAETATNNDGWYGFSGFLPGDYTIRYTYGSDDKTAMTKTSAFGHIGQNDTSYNGQDYESTTYTNKNGNYWYTVDDKKSDARDNTNRVNQVIDYSKKEYDRNIVNHKAEVFNAYINPQPSHIDSNYHRALADELAAKTYRYADTAQMTVEIEYARTVSQGNQENEHKITGVDFGISARPKSKLTIDQDIAKIKVTLQDGTVLFDADKGINNLQWVAKGDISKYDKGELVNAIIDEELINGAKLEVTYNITVKNESDTKIEYTKANNIINYVANNLNYNEADNNGLWKVVKASDIQTNANSTLINNTSVDLSSQSVILQATNTNPLISTKLKPGEQVTTSLTLTKVLSAEASTDSLVYTNMTEIVEIEDAIGRYDHEAVPGNQKLDEEPTEHDTSGSYNQGPGQDGTVIITPPTGSKYIYYVIGITSAVILLGGIYFIRKFVRKEK